jgi:PIN domain nuclease of toxin-antitoxin system
LGGSDKLYKDWVGMIDSSKNNIFYSSAPTAGIFLNHATGNLEVPNNLFKVFLRFAWDELSLDCKDLKILFSVPLFHGNPFDRMQKSQII